MYHCTGFVKTALKNAQKGQKKQLSAYEGGILGSSFPKMISLWPLSSMVGGHSGIKDLTKSKFWGNNKKSTQG